MTSSELTGIIASASSQISDIALPVSNVESEGISPEFATNIQKLQNLYLAVQHGSDGESVSTELDAIESALKDISLHDLKLFNEELVQTVQKYINNYTIGINYERFKTSEIDCLPALLEYEMKHARNLLLQYSNLYQNLIRQNLLSISKLKTEAAEIRTNTTSDKKSQKDPHEIDNQISKYIDSIKAHKINIQRANNRFFETMDLIAHLIQKWIKLCNTSIQNIRN